MSAPLRVPLAAKLIAAMWGEKIEVAEPARPSGAPEKLPPRPVDKWRGRSGRRRRGA